MKYVDADVLDSAIQATANAIRRKTGSQANLVWDDNTGLTADIKNVQSYKENDVLFYDYEGTILYSYTAEDFLQLVEMPPNPDHTHDPIPLVSQGWNWSLTDAKEYVAIYGMLDIGQLYVTQDGLTHLILRAPLDPGPATQFRGFRSATSSDTVTVSIPGVFQKTFKSTADRTLDLYVHGGEEMIISGNFWFAQSNSGDNSFPVERIFLGSNCTTIRNYAFYNWQFLKSITIHKNVSNVGDWAFYGCEMLSHVNLPDKFATLRNHLFSKCRFLKSVSLPRNLKTVQDFPFTHTYSLRRVSIPNTVTSFGKSLFSRSGVQKVTSPVHNIGVGEYEYNHSPNRSIKIREGVTSIEKDAFQAANLTKVVIPSTVTSLGYYAFLYLLGPSVMMLPEYPPSGINGAFSTVFSSLTIYVESQEIAERYRAAISNDWIKVAVMSREEYEDETMVEV